MMRNILVASAALATFFAAPASAALVDFEALPIGDNGNPLTLSGATFTAVGGALRRRKTPLAFA